MKVSWIISSSVSLDPDAGLGCLHLSFLSLYQGCAHILAFPAQCSREKAAAWACLLSTPPFRTALPRLTTRGRVGIIPGDSLFHKSNRDKRLKVYKVLLGSLQNQFQNVFFFWPLTLILCIFFIFEKFSYINTVFTSFPPPLSPAPPEPTSSLKLLISSLIQC